MNKFYDVLGVSLAVIVAAGLVLLALTLAAEIIEASAERAREARSWNSE